MGRKADSEVEERIKGGNAMTNKEMYFILGKINQLRHRWIEENYRFADNDGEFEPNITAFVKDLARMMEEIEAEYKEEK